jgi:hypothetical protein
MNESVEKIVDPRVDVLKEFCLRSLRVKSEKWDRLMISDEQRSYIMSFVDRQTPQVKLNFQNI